MEEPSPRIDGSAHINGGFAAESASWSSCVRVYGGLDSEGPHNVTIDVHL
jgi:hypothetical protein